MELIEPGDSKEDRKKWFDKKGSFICRNCFTKVILTTGKNQSIEHNLLKDGLTVKCPYCQSIIKILGYKQTWER